MLFIGLYVVSAIRASGARNWCDLVATLAVIGVLMWGGVLGLTYVPQDSWGGLPITLILATFGLAFAFPLRPGGARPPLQQVPAVRCCACSTSS